MRRNVTSSYHGNMISGSQKSFLTETVVFSLSNDGRKVWDTVLFLIEIMLKNHTCQFFLFFPCHVCRTTTCWDPETLTTWLSDFTSLLEGCTRNWVKLRPPKQSLSAIWHNTCADSKWLMLSRVRGGEQGGRGGQGVQIFRLHCLAFLAPTL